jgi:hypothetical protein
MVMMSVSSFPAKAEYCFQGGAIRFSNRCVCSSPLCLEGNCYYEPILNELLFAMPLDAAATL